MEKIAIIPSPGFSYEAFFGMDQDARVLYKEGVATSRLLRRGLLEKGFDLCKYEKGAAGCKAVLMMDSLPYDVARDARDKQLVYLGVEPDMVNSLNSPRRLARLARHMDRVVGSGSRLKGVGSGGAIYAEYTIDVRDFLSQARDEPALGFADRKLACMLARRGFPTKNAKALFKTREAVANWFNDEAAASGDFDLYGIEWDGERLSNVYRGFAEDKRETYGRYRFAFSFNNNPDMFCTDKLLDCFKYGIVPIGNFAAFPEIPRDIYIEHSDFPDMGELYAYMKAMGEDEWKGYLARARAFLLSEEAGRYDVSATVGLLAGIFAEPARRKTALDLFGIRLAVMGAKLEKLRNAGFSRALAAIFRKLRLMAGGK
jgi:hypothetical protein